MEFRDKKVEQMLKLLKLLFEDPWSNVPIEHFQVLIQSVHEQSTRIITKTLLNVEVVLWLT